MVRLHALQMVLLDSLYGTERGLSASSELRGEISELITQLEAANPSDAPNQVPLAVYHKNHSRQRGSSSSTDGISEGCNRHQTTNQLPVQQQQGKCTLMLCSVVWSFR
jgi:PAP_fibrillin